MKIVLAVAVGILAFILGLAGAYMMMPKFDPELVSETDRMIDSLTLADSVRIRAERDSLAQTQAAFVDPQKVIQPVLDELEGAFMNAITDSLSALRQEVTTYDASIQRLEGQVKQLQSQWRQQEERRAEAGRMSGTLTKLEDKELSAVLAELDHPMLESLYVEASARNRKRLLQAIPPERAALLVKGLMTPDAPAAGVPAPDQTT